MLIGSVALQQGNKLRQFSPPCDFNKRNSTMSLVGISAILKQKISFSDVFWIRSVARSDKCC